MYFPMTRRRFLTQTGKKALAAGIGGVALAACGGSATPSGPVTLTYGWWSNTPAKDNSMKDWLKDFEKTNPNIKFKPEILPWTNYWDKLKTTTAGGNAYDVIGLYSGTQAAYFDSGALVDLSSRSDYQDAVKDLDAGTLKMTRWNDKTFALPIGVSISVLGYNKKLLRAAGVADPDPINPMTFDEFKAMAKKIHNGDTYAFNPIDIADFDTFVRLEGGSVYDNPVNPTKITINSPQGIKGLEDYKSLFTEGIAPPYDNLAPYQYDYAALETGKIAFARVGPWLFADMMKNPDYAIAPLFKIQKTAVKGTVNSLAIYKKSKYPDQAWEFLKWAVQTQPEISFGKFSDVPANTPARNQLDTYTQPKEWAATIKFAYSTYQPDLITTKDTLSTTFTDLINDFLHNKATAAETAAKMETQGNAILQGS